MKNSAKFAGFLFALVFAAAPAVVFAKPITNTTAHVHSATIHDRSPRQHSHESVAHH